jgi:SAM-dependent methyltransferase
MTPLLRIAATTLACAGLARAASEDVPFITTPDNVTLAMLQIARTNAHDYVIDLGSGDGRIVITAAKQFGARGLGVEIVPDLVRKSRENAEAAGVASRVEFREEDLFETDLSPASVITMYLLPEVNLELRPKLLALKPGTRIVSHDWDMGDWPPERSLQLEVPDKKIGREKSSKVHLWIVPAHLAGAWCGGSRKKPVTLQVDQKYSQMRGAFTRGGATHKFQARIRGTQVQSLDGDLVWNLEGDHLKAVVARNAFGALRTITFARRAGESCS